MPPSIGTSASSRATHTEHSCVLFQSLPFTTPFYGRTDIQVNFTSYSTPVFRHSGDTAASAQEIESNAHRISATALYTPTILGLSVRASAPPSSSPPPIATERTAVAAPPGSLLQAMATSLCSGEGSLHTNAEKGELTPYQANSFRGRYLLGVKIELPQDYVIALFTEVNEKGEDEEKKVERKKGSVLERKQPRHSFHSSLSSSLSLNSSFSSLEDVFCPSRIKRLRLETTSVPIATASPSLSHTNPSHSPPSSTLLQGQDAKMMVEDTHPHRKSLSGLTLSDNESFDIPFASSSFLVWSHDRIPESSSKAVQWIQLAKEIHGFS